MIKKASLALAAALTLVGCSGAFNSAEEKIDNSFTIKANTQSIMYVSEKGVSNIPTDANTSTTVTNPTQTANYVYTMETYPEHGTLTFSLPKIIYTPKTDYIGEDFYAFNGYDQYRDVITKYTTRITISPAAPVLGISGVPSTNAKVGSKYSFTPVSTGTGTFDIANKPSWATFNTATGKLEGTPGVGDVGTYSGIVIYKTDGSKVSELPPFTITVVV